MIIPLGHEQTTVRRQPWVTWTLIAVCFVAFLASNYLGGSVEERVDSRFQDAIEYYMERPYLELDPRLKELAFGTMPSSQEEGYIEVLREMHSDSEPSSVVIIEQHQLELDRLTAKAFGALDDLPWFRWGLVPANKTLHGFITYQFMHGGWLHLLGNMFFLFLAGPFVEDVWGRPVFLSFYLIGGVVSALGYAMRYPALDVPLIGASASVAAVMGAFLVRYFSTKIKFFYWFFVFFKGTFDAPAWLMLPLWFARELFFAQAMDVMGTEGGSSVAHWAHVFGFGFGVAVALGIRQFKLEERYLHKAIEEKVTLFDNSAIEDAMETIRDGRLDEGLAMLRQVSAEQPENIDAAVAFWNMALEHSQPALAAPYLLKAIQRAIRSNEIEVVDPQFLELASSVPEQPYDPATALKLSEFLRENERENDAEEMLEAAARSVDASTPPGVLLRLAREGARQRVPVTGVFASLAVDSAELPEDAAEEMRLLIDRFPPPAPAAVEAPVDAFPDEYPADLPSEKPPPLPRTIQVMDAQPTALDADTLSVVVKGKARRLPVDHVQAVAVAGVAPAGERSFIVIDLLLDSPLGDARTLRCLRVRSTHFDPRQLVGGEQPMAAFRELLAKLVQYSGATCLPDPEIMQGGALSRFQTLDAYEREVLEVGS